MNRLLSDHDGYLPVFAHITDGKRHEVKVAQAMIFPAGSIVAIDKDRWQIEIIFKTIKQNLRIKTFVGTSRNALPIQIWTALIVVLILKYLKLRSLVQ